MKEKKNKNKEHTVRFKKKAETLNSFDVKDFFFRFTVFFCCCRFFFLLKCFFFYIHSIYTFDWFAVNGVLCATRTPSSVKIPHEESANEIQFFFLEKNIFRRTTFWCNWSFDSWFMSWHLCLFHLNRCILIKTIWLSI